MSVDGFRIPLQDSKIEINTPLPMKSIHNQKITTPPGSVSGIKKQVSDANSSLIETPIKNYDNGEGIDGLNLSKHLLLSPAFSSPQNHLKYNSNASSQYPYLRPSQSQAYNSSPPPVPSTNLSSFDDEFDQEKPKKKKKKDKKAFDIQSNDKPPYSYATLIGMSILSHPDKRLTLSSIYQWISETFKYYKKEDVGWQNSIRHNLSLNKAFIKGEKSKDGKGHFWCIEAGCEDQFLKSRNNKKGSYQEIMEQIYNSSQSNHLNQQSELQQMASQQLSQEPQGLARSRKRTIGSIPSSPNYYDSNEASFAGMNEAADYHRKNDNHFHEEMDEDDVGFHKRQKVSNRSDLGAPFDQNWSLSPPPAKTNNGTHFDLMNTPKVIISHSPNKPLVAGKNLTFTSSFSCNSNLELSPIRPNETGPLLQPLTPGKVYKAGAINHHIPNIQYQSSHVFSNSSNTNLNSAHFNPSQSISNAINSTSQTTNQPQNLKTTNTQPTSHHASHTRSHSFNLVHMKTPKATIKTPIRILKTPQTSAKKLWNSPGYLDDFYYSPLITSQSALHSYDDDDMILRAFESPANSRKIGSQSSIESSRTLFKEGRLSSSVSSADKLHD
ncbi:Forkhead transcription factor [Yamadazyma tenuis]|uniref:Forkhead transcription factor n=1 Tax=Candida tenuis TaxID=2315449 RepID=UPI00279A4225|nr:Forkhead transcription factor [Yamadazyma tenuis]